jgi:hypothetical protein
MRVLLGFLLFLTALPAHAWVPALAPSGCFERWYTPDVNAVSVKITADSSGIGAIAASDVHTAMLSAMQTWNDVQCGLCANPGGPGCAPQVCATNPLGVALEDGGIGTHTPWGFQCEKQPDGPCWPKPNGSYVVAVTQKADWLWGQFAASITPVVSNNATGEIIDADILFNLAPRDDGGKFAFCQGDCAAKPGAYPLCIVLTHEMGHLLGLNHSLDTKATMFASAIPSDVAKCSLSDDDKLGICTIFRETCSGVPGEITLTTAQCDAKAAAIVPDVTTPAISCQASARVASPWSLWLLVAAVSLTRLAASPGRPRSGRSRAKSR